MKCILRVKKGLLVRVTAVWIGAINPFESRPSVSETLIQMDPSMDIATHPVLDCQQEGNGEVSLDERRSSFAECSTPDSSSSVIHIDNSNPSADWQLPPSYRKMCINSLSRNILLVNKSVYPLSISPSLINRILYI